MPRKKEKLANQIMTASSSDNKLFHKLLRTQRSDGNRFTKTLRRDNQMAETNEDILHMWTDYFYELSNPDYKQDFDYEKYELSTLQNTIIEKIEKGKLKLNQLERRKYMMLIEENKDRQNPANYRGITVTKIFTKILQCVLKSRIDIKIHQIQNQLQRGFTEAIPMIFAAFLASEAIIQSSEDDQEVLLLTLDAEKAF
ncbi:unnamed protein product [Mytilus coruscus]|uniref:Reverse transcriptase domain-containing protein n=1 Tax=Mytilus coruscus TaxID=42192 RepID=A0A6J8B2D0_MYTCO|nr:unnamed protein product [Mytilus coruscus]